MSDPDPVTEALFLAGQIAGLLQRTKPETLHKAALDPGLRPEYARIVQEVANLAERLSSSGA